jgi:hypothetical protein
MKLDDGFLSIQSTFKEIYLLSIEQYQLMEPVARPWGRGRQMRQQPKAGELKHQDPYLFTSSSRQYW